MVRIARGGGIIGCQTDKGGGVPLTKKRITLFDKKITTQKKSKLAHLRLLSKSNRL